MKAACIGIVIAFSFACWVDSSLLGQESTPAPSQSSTSVSPPQAPAPGGNATSAKGPAESVGLYVYPTKQQDAAQQTKDEGECFDSAKQQTGWDPAAPAQPAQANAGQAKGGGVKGSARGAAGGAAIGAIAGDAGEGAAIGATAGAVAGRRRQKKANKQAQQQAQQAAQTQQQQQLDGFKRSMSACLEAGGYTAK